MEEKERNSLFEEFGKAYREFYILYLSKFYILHLSNSSLIEESLITEDDYKCLERFQEIKELIESLKIEELGSKVDLADIERQCAFAISWEWIANKKDVYFSYYFQWEYN